MSKYKIGTLFGVFIPNVTMMFGVILFLRLGLIVGHAGLPTTLAIIALSLLIMLITSLSVASIATNMDVGGGGIYYLVTRSLGIEIGGALGIAIYLSQLLSITITASGFAYTIVEILPHLNLIHVEVVTFVALASLASFSANLALKTQGLIFLILIFSIVTVFFGSTANITPVENPIPFYQDGKLTFWAAFALLYPALTGIEAGMALSGTLKSPGRSLMIGNISSLIFVAFTYAAVVTFAYIKIPHEILISDPFALKEFANPSWIITMGILAATISSALGSILGAPRMLQSMSDDGVTPAIFSKTIGKYNEPIFALIFTTGAAFLITVSTSIDQIMPILAMICLFSYGLLNLIAAIATLMNSPSWRPQLSIPFYYPLTCVGIIITVMFFINPKWSLTSFALITTFYFFLKRRNLDATFQDFRDSIIFFLSRIALYRLSSTPDHAHTWHPQILVPTTAPSSHPKLIYLANSLTRNTGILAFASILPDEWASREKIDFTQQSLDSFFEKHNIRCITQVQSALSTHEGYINLIKNVGLGPIQPNTVLLPLSEYNAPGPIVEYFHASFISRKNLVLFIDSDNTPNKIFKSKKLTKKKQIDVWWNSDGKESFDLLVSLANLLHDSPVWSNAIINLRAIAPAQEAASNLNEYLNSFISQSRLKMTAHIHLHEDQQDFMPCVKNYSKNADLVLLPLTPLNDEASIKNYRTYIKEVIHQTTFLPPTLIVTCFDDIEHKEIYTYPESQ